MLRKLLISAAAIAMSAPASAAFVVTFPSTTALLPINDFRPQLNALGFDSYASNGATISLTQASLIRFDFFASESGNNDTFLAGPLSRTETTSFTAWMGPNGQVIGSTVFGAGSLTGLLNFTSNGPQAQSATVGQTGFGIFTNANTISGFSSNVLWFGYDDQITRVADDNHDDFIVRATIVAVPEPATWAMMVGGVGIAGMALRRRRRNASAAVMA